MKKVISAILVVAVFISILTASATTFSAATDGLPDFVDNSTSKYFPPIKSQGSQGSCVAWSQAYYQFTYEMNKSLDRESTAENCFSPTFTYNMSNYGEDVGCFPNNTYGNMKKIGVAPWSTVPYTMEEHRNWYPDEKIWQEAAKYRVDEVKVLPNFRTGSGKQVTYPDDPDLTQIKTLLNEGHILSFGAYINRWKKSTIKTNSAYPENDKYAGEDVVTATSPDIGNGYGHRMTLVGYNDNLWVDVNGNNKVDNGEIGAFKVANSYGPWWGNDGFIWFAYDNINMETSVEGGLPYKVMSGVVDVTTISVLPYNSDADVYMRYTLNTSDRANSVVTITAEKGSETYTLTAGPHHESPYLNNHYSLDGKEEATDGTLIFMLSNVVPGLTEQTVGDYKWSVKFEDTKADGKALIVKNAEIVDLSTNRISKAQGVFNFSLDGTSKTLTFPQLATAHKVLYYKGFDAPYINYTDEKGNSITVALTQDSSQDGYTHKFVFTNGILKDSAVSFTDGNLTDDNDGKGYELLYSTNFCTTEIEKDVKLIGDANCSGEINIMDATYLQQFLAFIIDRENIDTETADSNRDNNIDISDASRIQRYLANLNDFGSVGDELVKAIYKTTISDTNENIIIPTEPSVDETTDETEVPTTKPTETPVLKNKVTFTNSLNWSGTIYCYYWSDSNTAMVTWPGKAMTKSGTNEFNQTLYTFEVPQNATKIIFTNGSSQTVDISYSGGETKYYAENSKTGNGYNVGTW